MRQKGIVRAGGFHDEIRREWGRLVDDGLSRHALRVRHQDLGLEAGDSGCEISADQMVEEFNTGPAGQ
ncbi:hypothetical protein D3C77_778770 [compost metagenome]